MTDPLAVSAHERGVTRVFALNLPKEQIATFVKETYGPGDDDYDWPLRNALGIDALDHDFVEVIDLSDLSEYGLLQYLIDGHGVDAKQIAPDAARLSAITGHVVIVSSSAFGQFAQTLAPKPPLDLVATYREAPPIPPMDALPSESAKGALETGETAQAPGSLNRGLLIVVVALAVVVLAVLWLVGGGS
ncbi:MAG: hypothetical protein HKO95_15730 [Rhodobacteraceae bacterium]|nr:hypothetical protein [Alphaproteobacteria bacterium]NNK68176.1 hypothetical protein [Paracoccaceae bacterium]